MAAAWAESATSKGIFSPGMPCAMQTSRAGFALPKRRRNGEMLSTEPMKPPPIPGQRHQPRRLGGLATVAIVVAIGCAAFMVGVQAVSFVRGFKRGFAEARSSKQSDKGISRLLPSLSRDREDDDEIK